MYKYEGVMNRFAGLLFLLLVFSCRPESGTRNSPVAQRSIGRIDSMPALPSPLEIIDWQGLALRFDSLAYNFSASGDYWPLVWWDSTARNFDQPVVGLYTAMGDARQGARRNHGMFHESLATMGGVLGATLVGIDKSNQDGLNYVGMLKNYFNRETGWNIMMNNTAPEVAMLGGGYGRDWWYDIYPNVLFYAIYDQYPDEPGLEEIARTIADQFYRADSVLDGNYNWTFFDYGAMKPMKNRICAQQDAAAGHAWVLYAAYRKFGDEKYLRGARRALNALVKQTENRFYEILMPFGAYTAARLNAEQGEDLDVQRLLKWTFSGTSTCRKGWGVLLGSWNGFDISGIVGSTADHGGYGFLMNTFDTAWPLVAMVRYDPAYATAIGKWMLNAANASRLFYPGHMPAEHQTIPGLASATKGVIAYEGLAKHSTYEKYKHLRAPVAQGDGPNWVPGKNPDVSQFSVYGSAHVGLFGGMIAPTNIEGILRLDCLKTDFFGEKAYPTYLYYNPYGERQRVKINAGDQPVDLYDAVERRFVGKDLTGETFFEIDAEAAALITVVPAAGHVTYEKNKMLINGIVVDYRVQ